MVSLIQRSQNKDARAVHLKLNEVVAALQGASNRLINVEDLTETEIRLLHAHYQAGHDGQAGRQPHRLSLGRGGRQAAPHEDASCGAGDERKPDPGRGLASGPTTRVTTGGRDGAPIGQRSNRPLESA